MKSVRRILALVLALCTVISMTACFGGKDSKPEKTVVENVYKTQTYSLPEGMQYVNSFYKTSDGYIAYGEYVDENDVYSTKFAKLDENFEFVEFIDFNFEAEGDYWLNGIVGADDGTLWGNVNTSFYDEETGYYESKNHLIHLDSQMNLLSSKTVNDLLGLAADEYAYINSLTPLSDGKIVFMSNETLYIADSEMNIVFTKAVSDFNGAQYINRIVKSPKGLVVIYADAEWVNKAVIFDTNTMSFGKEYDFSNLGYGMYYEGAGDYDLYYNDDSGIHGYSFDNEEGEELMNYMNSDLMSFYPNSLIPIENDSFVCVTWDPDEGNEMCFLKLTPVPDEEATPKYVITLGCLYLNYRIREQIYKFNRTNDEYRIVLKDYSADISYGTDSEFTYEDAIAKMNSDIASGDVPDLFVCTSELPFDSYASKGLFDDLYTYIDSDADLSREDFEQNVLKVFETDSKLYRIAPQYSVQGYAGLESVIGEYADNWNTDSFLALANSLPEDCRMFSDMTRDMMMNIFMYGMYGEFVDVNTGKCSFDDGAFAKVLEYTKTLSDKSIYDTIDWETVNDSFWEDMDNAVPEGRVALSSIYVSSFADITSWINYTFRTEDIVLLGFPTASGNPVIMDSNGSIAISSKSKLKDGAWAFVKSLLSEEYQNNLDWELPIRTASLENMMAEQIKLAQDEKKQREEGDITGGVIDDDFAVMPMPRKMVATTEVAIDVDGDGIVDTNGEERPHIYLDEYYAGILLDYIRSADMLYQCNTEVMAIVNEEAGRFFDGKCSSAEAADAVQSRVRVYLSENR